MLDREERRNTEDKDMEEDETDDEDRSEFEAPNLCIVDENIKKCRQYDQAKIMCSLGGSEAPSDDQCRVSLASHCARRLGQPHDIDATGMSARRYMQGNGEGGSRIGGLRVVRGFNNGGDTLERHQTRAVSCWSRTMREGEVERRPVRRVGLTWGSYHIGIRVTLRKFQRLEKSFADTNQQFLTHHNFLDGSRGPPRRSLGRKTHP
ncbi:hypothetical protein C8F01DRAFT_1078510 [Mycena amicta]|nr:hypothetical protein C8F01DRAFT_1078510 [Mycena amicta]